MITRATLVAQGQMFAIQCGTKASPRLWTLGFERVHKSGDVGIALDDVHMACAPARNGVLVQLRPGGGSSAEDAVYR
jgi:hypothetical protein